MMERHLSKSLLLTLMLAVFLDVANFFMPIPVFTPLLLHTPFLHGFSQSSKPLILGGLMACYGLAQLLGGPIFGELSDQHGRKKF
jgi:MFS family permease